MTYYTATIDHWSVASRPQVKSTSLKSTSLRQVMRFAAQLSATLSASPHAEIIVCRHEDGLEPQCAKRLIKDRRLAA